MGTHVKLRVRRKELPLEKIQDWQFELKSNLVVDEKADAWISKHIFRASIWGVTRRFLESLILSLLKNLKKNS